MKRMLIFLFLITIFALPVQATSSYEFDSGEKTDIYTELYDSSGAGDLEKFVLDDFRKFAYNHEITPTDPFSFGNLFKENALKDLFEYFKKRMLSPLSAGAIMMSAILVCAIASCIGENNVLQDSSINIVGVLVCTIAFTSPIISLMQKTALNISLVAGFMTAFIPVFAAILIAALRAQTALGFTPILYFGTNLAGYLGAYIVTPASSMFLATGIAGSMSGSQQLSGLSNALKKIAIWVLSGSMAIFTAIISIQTLITGTADNAGTKTAKFFISSFIPIIGASVSEALGSLKGCADVLKSSIGVYAVIVVLFITVPVMIELFIFKLTLSFCGMSAGIFSLSNIKAIIEAINNTLSILLAAILCVCIMFVFSVSILAAAGGS